MGRYREIWVAWKSISVVLRVKESRESSSSSLEVSRKTCGRLVCEASRREKAMVLLSGMVTCTGGESGGGRSAEEAGEAQGRTSR